MKDEFVSRRSSRDRVGKVRAGEPCAARLILFGSLDLGQIRRPGIAAAIDNPIGDGLQGWVQGSQVLKSYSI